jgi:hypothetical protein
MASLLTLICLCKAPSLKSDFPRGFGSGGFLERTP